MRHAARYPLLALGALIAGVLALGAFTGCAEDTARAPAAAATISSDPVVEVVRQQAAARASGDRVDFDAPSIAFPADTDYAQGLRQIFLMEAGLSGAGEATIAGPLPKGAIVDLPEKGQGLRIGLAAPYGYDGNGERPLLTPLRVPDPAANAPMSKAGPWPEGAALPVPTLPDCMISRSGAPPATKCLKDDVAQLRGDAISLP